MSNYVWSADSMFLLVWYHYTSYIRYITAVYDGKQAVLFNDPRSYKTNYVENFNETRRIYTMKRKRVIESTI